MGQQPTPSSRSKCHDHIKPPFPYFHFITLISDLAKTFSELLKKLFWIPKISESDFVSVFPAQNGSADLELNEDA